MIVDEYDRFPIQDLIYDRMHRFYQLYQVKPQYVIVPMYYTTLFSRMDSFSINTSCEKPRLFGMTIIESPAVRNITDIYVL